MFKINFYGINSQYHWWLFGDLFHSEKTERKGIIRGDFGISYNGSKPISEKMQLTILRDGLIGNTLVYEKSMKKKLLYDS